MKLLLSLLQASAAEIIIHPGTGAGFELMNDKFIIDEEYSTIKLHQPVAVSIAPGQFQGEMTARVQTVMKKTLDALGLNQYQYNRTTEEYSCRQTGWIDCDDGWTSFASGFYSKLYKL